MPNVKLTSATGTSHAQRDLLVTAPLARRAHLQRPEDHVRHSLTRFGVSGAYRHFVRRANKRFGRDNQLDRRQTALVERQVRHDQRAKDIDDRRIDDRRGEVEVAMTVINFTPTSRRGELTSARSSP